MGRSAILVDLKHEKHPQSIAKLRAVVLEWLGVQWDVMLDKRLADEAWGWVSIGRDSLLTIGDYDADQGAPADKIWFWFFRGVDWPMNRAEHYLRGALFRGRAELDEKLAHIGYRVSGVPSTKESIFKQHDSLDHLEKPCPVCNYLTKF
jgi:hypothetical protein